MQLVGVRVELPTNQPIVLLREREGERFLPIWIGPVEATAIAFALQGIVTQRPMTHDLLKSVLEEVGVTIERIVITELRETTFYATLEMARDGAQYSVSSRPSDAIALAVRSGVPIFAAPDVLSDAGSSTTGRAQSSSPRVSAMPTGRAASACTASTTSSSCV